METSMKSTLDNGKGKLMCCQEDSPASLSVKPDKEEEQKTTAISGHKWSESLAKSSPLGLLQKTLLESYRWWNPIVLLRWKLRQVYSERIITFTDTITEYPSPTNKSAKILRNLDMKSSHLLFQLAPLARPTDVIGYSLSHLIQTPTSFDDREMKSWDTVQSTGTLGQQAMMGKLNHLIPTPLTQGLKECVNGHTVYANLDLLPTPTARMVEHPGSEITPNGRRIYKDKKKAFTMGLADLDRKELLPTPIPSGEESATTLEKRKGVRFVKANLYALMDSITPQVNDGSHSQLSPLFTEELMGFPYLWTFLPFRLEDGASNPCAPTATPSSHK